MSENIGIHTNFTPEQIRKAWYTFPFDQQNLHDPLYSTFSSPFAQTFFKETIPRQFLSINFMSA